MPRTLLLADANTAIQRIVALMFATEDVRVVSVSDGEDAVARIAAERPDIVLADVAMPKRNGYEVAAFVKGRPELAHIPVLLLAGALEPVDQALAAAARCDGVLVKPFEPQQVIARVRELIGGARGNPARIVPGVPRPIDRVVEPRQAPTRQTPLEPPPSSVPQAVQQRCASRPGPAGGRSRARPTMRSRTISISSTRHLTTSTRAPAARTCGSSTSSPRTRPSASRCRPSARCSAVRRRPRQRPTAESPPTRSRR